LADCFECRGHLSRRTTLDQPGLNSHLYDGSNDYDALDRFNRTTISRWTTSGGDRYHVTLTYDRNSNIVTLDDSVQTGFDWKYTYGTENGTGTFDSARRAREDANIVPVPFSGLSIGVSAA